VEREGAEANKELVIQALTNPEFRERLTADPARVLGKKLSDVNREEVRRVLDTVYRIEEQIASLADQLLCATNGDPCGIAAT
jgi:hypothetical protein